MNPRDEILRLSCDLKKCSDALMTITINAHTEMEKIEAENAQLIQENKYLKDTACELMHDCDNEEVNSNNEEVI